MATKVLYVEDEIFLGKIVQETLSSKGYDVNMVADGALVMEAFRHFQPDICVLDIMLPNKSGLELAADIRAIDPAVPILFLTAKTQTEDLVKGFQQGGDDYIRKPFSMEELMVRMEYALGKRGQKPTVAAGHQPLALGNLVFDPVKQTLGREGQATHKLSYREAQLLQYCWDNRHQLISRKELLLHIWGNDSFFNSRNLDVYINKIRSYLREGTGVEIITMKGVGYRFVVG